MVCPNAGILMRGESARMGYECFPAMRKGSSHLGFLLEPFLLKGGK